MKNPELGDYLKWQGELAQIAGVSNELTVEIMLLKNECCPHCGGDIGKKQFSVIPTSRFFQDNVEAIQTLKK